MSPVVGIQACRPAGSHRSGVVLKELVSVFLSDIADGELLFLLIVCLVEARVICLLS